MRARRRLALGARWWALGFVLLTLGLQALSQASVGWRFVRHDFAAGAWWQLLSAQWVHMGYAHAGVNALAMVVLLWAFEGLVAARPQCLALLGGHAGVALLLALDPNCGVYAGASGALHGLLAGNACSLLLGRQSPAGDGKRKRLLGLGIGFALLAKLLLQQLGADPSALGWLGFPSYYPAHAAGALGGLLAVLLAHALGPRRPAHPVGR